MIKTHKMIKNIAFLMTIAVATATHPVRFELVDAVNNDPSSTWIAQAPDQNKFSSWTEDEIKGLFGLQMKPFQTTMLRGSKQPTFGTLYDAEALPKNFDSRTGDHASCLKPIRDQQQCGSCWAFGAAETLSDNLCVMGHDAGVLSPQDLVSCDTKNKGCNGGDLIDAWAYLANTGIVTDQCMPYTAFNGTRGTCEEHGCPKFKCTAGSSSDGSTYNFLSEENDIKWAVYNFGSAETGFYVYEDFMNYKSGVYTHQSGQVLGGHAVKIVGWGTDSISGDYWTVANSWGTSWGMQGYFKIAMKDKDSAFAMGGAFNCGKLGPAPAPAPAPGPAPGPKCADLLPSDKCAQFKDNCAKAVWMECAETCGCCKEFGKPDYCGKTNSLLEAFAAAKSQHFHLVGGNDGNQCDETLYNDDAFTAKGWKQGRCSGKFNTVLKKTKVMVCDGQSQTNLKYCPDTQTEIIIVRKGITGFSE
jgi:cathepsin B